MQSLRCAIHRLKRAGSDPVAVIVTASHLDEESKPSLIERVPVSGEYPVESGRRGREILDALATAVVVVDAVGKIEFANTRAGEVLERTPASLVGTEVQRILAPFDVVRSAAAAPEGDEMRQSLTLPDAAQVTIGYRVRRLAGEAYGLDSESYAIVFQDITHWEKLREERDRLMRLAAVSEVLPSILHELKNPLAAVATAVELLVEDCTDVGLRERMHAILPEIRRMGLTLEGIGSVGRELSSTRYSAIDHALRESFMVLERQATERGISFECAVPIMPLLPFDAAMIRAIAFNLLTNAIHACSRGDGIVLSAVLVAGAPDALRVSVTDTGAGMSSEVVRRCTELFFTTKPRGTGIGLALCERAARSAGGTLKVESTPGVGTKVILEVPVSTGRRAPVGASARKAGN